MVRMGIPATTTTGEHICVEEKQEVEVDLEAAAVAIALAPANFADSADSVAEQHASHGA